MYFLSDSATGYAISLHGEREKSCASTGVSPSNTRIMPCSTARVTFRRTTLSAPFFSKATAQSRVAEVTYRTPRSGYQNCEKHFVSYGMSHVKSG